MKLFKVTKSPDGGKNQNQIKIKTIIVDRECLVILLDFFEV
jgi:hypothetical protein